ncbi:MAG: methyltransferase family protein [Hyphomicrobium sp.]
MKIQTVQTVRKLVLVVGIGIGAFLFAVTASTYPGGGRTHELIEWFGVVLIVMCILGRTWASLYIGGRKIEELVQTGPYSITRNPLYLFSFFGAAGVGAQHGSITLAALCAGIVVGVFYVVVRQEERVMSERYGSLFRNYLARVPRFIPNPWLWRDEPTLTARPPLILRTFGDALLFLLAVPAAEFSEYLQDVGVLPVLLRLP